MTQPLNLGNCCGPSIPGIRKISFPDGDQVGLIGLDAVLEAVFKEGMLPDDYASNNSVLGSSPRSMAGGHRDAQNRTANAALTWLRAICVTVVDNDPQGWQPPMSATDIAQLCKDQDIEVPELGPDCDVDTAKRGVGILMGSLFKSHQSQTIPIDNYLVSRTQRMQKRENGSGPKETFYYQFCDNEKSKRPNAPSATGHIRT